MRRLLMMATFLLAPAMAHAAQAAPMPQPDSECTTDADCAKGEVCMLVSGGCPPCEPGTECGECDPGNGEMACVSGGGWSWTNQCETDADCGAAMICTEQTIGCASGGAACACPDCAPGETCEPCDCKVAPEPEPCEDEIIKVCEPAPCSTDAECGDGFECVTVESCWASGGCTCDCACPACEPGEDCGECVCDDDCGCDEEPTSGCEVIGSYCSLKPTECVADTDCPSGYHCSFGWGGTDCACATCACEEGTSCECPPCECDEPVSNGGSSGTSTGSAGGGSSSSGGSAGAAPEENGDTDTGGISCEEAGACDERPATSGMCVSDFGGGWGEAGGGYPASAEDPQSGEGTGGPKGGDGDSGGGSGGGSSNVDDSEGGGNGGSGGGGSGGGGSGSGANGGGSVTGSAGDGTSSGCSAAAGNAGAGTLALLMFGFGLAVVARRRGEAR